MHRNEMLYVGLMVGIIQILRLSKFATHIKIISGQIVVSERSKYFCSQSTT